MNRKTSYLSGILGVKEFAIFCGAGISKNSGLPLANELKQYILERLLNDKKDIAEIMNSNLPFELFMEEVAISKDISKILEVFRGGEPNTNHILIARLAKEGYIKTIFTTNFDLLIEGALKNERLKKGVDFNVYSTEEDFTKIDFNNIGKEISIFKIHGSADDEESIRTTLSAVASKRLSDKRMNVIRYLFSTGKHKKVLVLGYSCSDAFDITPQILSIERGQKEIIFVDHLDRKEIEEMEDIAKKDGKNPFKNYPGMRIICDTNTLIGKMWISLKDTLKEKYNISPSEDERRKVESEWKKYVDNWSEELEKEEKEYLNYAMPGAIFGEISDYKRAIEYLEKALAIAGKMEYRVRISACCIGLGVAYLGVRRFNDGIKHYKQDLAIAEDIRDTHVESACYVGLGLAYFNLGNTYVNLKEFDQAIKSLKEALEIVKEKIKDKNIESQCYLGLGLAYLSLRKYKQAIEFLLETEKIFKEINQVRFLETVYEMLVFAYDCLGDYKRAIEYLLKSEKIFNETGQIHLLKRVYRNSSFAYEKIGDNKNTEKYKKLADFR